MHHSDFLGHVIFEGYSLLRVFTFLLEKFVKSKMVVVPRFHVGLYSKHDWEHGGTMSKKWTFSGLLREGHVPFG